MHHYYGSIVGKKMIASLHYVVAMIATLLTGQAFWESMIVTMPRTVAAWLVLPIVFAAWFTYAYLVPWLLLAAFAWVLCLVGRITTWPLRTLLAALRPHEPAIDPGVVYVMQVGGRSFIGTLTNGEDMVDRLHEVQTRFGAAPTLLRAIPTDCVSETEEQMRTEMSAYHVGGDWYIIPNARRAH